MIGAIFGAGEAYCVATGPPGSTSVGTLADAESKSWFFATNESFCVLDAAV